MNAPSCKKGTPVDPYDFIAARLPADTRSAIVRFWEAFSKQADELDQAFLSKDSARVQNVIGVMEALREVSPELMWEFGPSERGHALCVTAEWRDELRPLARLVRQMAPDLPRWQFIEARTPDEAHHFSTENFSARFRTPLTLSAIQATLGEEGRINLVGQGEGDLDALGQQALYAASMLLGEEVERDWVGACDGVETKGGMLSFLRKPSGSKFDPAAFQDSFLAEIACAKAALSDVPYSQLSIEDRSVVLFQVNQLSEDHRRSDLITLSAPEGPFAHGVLRSPRFSSRCYSLHDEWFLYLRIPRSPEASFDLVDERYDVEILLHERLAADGVGGFVAGGHGTEAVYIDLAVTNVELAVARIGQALADKPYAQEATLHFMDSGLEFNVLPAVPTNPQFH